MLPGRTTAKHLQMPSVVTSYIIYYSYLIDFGRFREHLPAVSLFDERSGRVMNKWIHFCSIQFLFGWQRLD